MKIGIFSDLHLMNFREFAKPAGYGLNSRALAALDVLKQVGQVAAKQHLDLVTFCGDFWETRGYVHTALFNAARLLLTEITQHCPLVMIGGNHDAATRAQDGITAIRLFEDLPNVHILGGGAQFELDDICVYGFHSDETIEPVSTSRKRYNVLLLHALVQGSLLENNYVADHGLDKKWLLDYVRRCKIDYVFLGDAHHRQRLASNVDCVGNCLQKTFSDEGQRKGMLLLNTQMTKIQFIPLQAPEFRTVKAAQFEAAYNDCDYFRVQPGTPEEYEKISKQGLWNVRVLPPLRFEEKVRVAVDLSMDRRKIIREYVESQCDDPVRAKRLFQLGLKLFPETNP